MHFNQGKYLSARTPQKACLMSTIMKPLTKLIQNNQSKEEVCHKRFFCFFVTTILNQRPNEIEIW